MKHNFSINYKMWLLAVLCCMIIMPGITYAQDESIPLGVEHEQYVLDKTENILVKVYGSIELDGHQASRTHVVLIHTAPDGESKSHNVRTNNYGYYEIYFMHNWDSLRGDYKINVSKDTTDIGNVSYKLIQDPLYKTDSKVKQEYWIEKEKKEKLIETITDAFEYYQANKKQEVYWMKNLFHWHYTHNISEEEVIKSIQYLKINNILKLD